MERSNLKLTRLLHPFLFALHPVLALFSTNVDELVPSALLLPTTALLLTAILLLLAFAAVFRNAVKAALATSFFLLLFFSYFHVFDTVQIGWQIATFRHSHLMFTWAVLFAGVSIFIFKTKKSLINLTTLLNVVSFGLILFSLVKIGAHLFMPKVGWQEAHLASSGPKKDPPGALTPDGYPNIYYIILDAYGRQDMLHDLYGHDNSQFINHLTDRGFYVAERSKANYCQTQLSLASSLNFQYLADLADQVGAENTNTRYLSNMIKNNHLIRFLRQFGYQTIAFDTSGFEPILLRNADLFFTNPEWGLDPFSTALINTTPIPKLSQYLPRLKIISPIKRYEHHRKRILYAFDKLGDVAKSRGPMFVFAHFLLPHKPFVFGADGQIPIPQNGRLPFKSLKGRQYIAHYIGQLKFTNEKIIKIIDKILADSPEPPVIILQADHGPASKEEFNDVEKADIKERIPILNAYFLPKNGGRHLYHEISPVNTFRVILNHYFGTEYKLLKDQSYWSSWEQPYKFTNISDRLDSGPSNP